MKKIKRIAYLGTDFFSGCLDALGAAGYEILWIYTGHSRLFQHNEHMLAVAEQQRTRVFKDKISAYELEFLAAEGCDLVISAAYPYQIPAFETAPRMINIYPELLPRGRSPWPLPWVILNNLQVSGVTIHKISPQIDGGDLLAQLTFPISERGNLESLSCKVQMKAPDLLLEVLKKFDDYWENALPQQNGEYWPMPNEKERTLDWNLPVAQLDKIARAFGKLGSYAFFDDQKWKTEDISVWAEPHRHKPGTVVLRNGGEVVIAAADGYVCLRFFQPVLKEEK